MLGGCDATVGHWRMNETSGTRVIDSARHHHGTSSHVRVGQSGKEGTAYWFNGTTSLITVPNADDLNPYRADFTFSAWEKSTSLPSGTDWDLLRKGLNQTTGGYKLEIFNTNGTGTASCYFKDRTTAVTVNGGSRHRRPLASPHLHPDRQHRRARHRRGQSGVRQSAARHHRQQRRPHHRRQVEPHRRRQRPSRRRPHHRRSLLDLFAGVRRFHPVRPARDDDEIVKELGVSAADVDRAVQEAAKELS